MLTVLGTVPRSYHINILEETHYGVPGDTGITLMRIALLEATLT